MRHDQMGEKKIEQNQKRWLIVRLDKMRQDKMRQDDMGEDGIFKCPILVNYLVKCFNLTESEQYDKNLVVQNLHQHVLNKNYFGI